MDNQDYNAANTAAAVGVMAGKAIAKAEAEGPAQLRTAPNGRVYRIAGNGAIEILDSLSKGPHAREGCVNVFTGDSFAEYVNRFKNPTTLLFADVIARKFTAVMDYFAEGPTGAGDWDRHRVELALRHTPDWNTWVGSNKKAMDQASFGQFLEDNLPNIAEPAGATIVQIARTLEAKINATFESDIRPDDGSYSLKYAEDVQSQAGRGTLKIPNEFTLVLQPFEGSKQYTVKARFRYKLVSGKLTMWYDLIRLEDVVRTAFAEEQERIDDSINNDDKLALVPILAGPAPAAK
jgi:uncharacterized protein YfdQ (DUF2303 family)